jgi:hypothetical protein
MRRPAALLVLAALALPAAAQPDLADRLARALPDARVEEIAADPPFSRAFEIRLPQPVDHDTPGGDAFEQRLFLFHRGADRPLVLETHGYAVGPRSRNDLGEVLGANHLLVEHRYYGASVPAGRPWRHLTLRQAAADYHRIAGLLRPLYPGPWVGTGRSKGGETALAYRRHYPDDVRATVAYVAPLILAREDPRIDRFLERAGGEACQDRLAAFQRAALARRDELVPLLRAHADSTGAAFSIGWEAALEYAVLESPFSFWQWTDGDCAAVPAPDAPARALFDHLSGTSGWSLYSDAGIARYEPSFYQHMRELGYYGFVDHHVADLLRAVPRPANEAFAPRGVDLAYDRRVVQDLLHWLDRHGDRVAYVYGAQDPWTAAAVSPSGWTDALRLDVEGGNHAVGFRDLGSGQQHAFCGALARWLDVDSACAP